MMTLELKYRITPNGDGSVHVLFYPANEGFEQATHHGKDLASIADIFAYLPTARAAILAEVNTQFGEVFT